MSNWKKNFNLEQYNTFHLSSIAAYFAEFFCEEELLKLISCVLNKKYPFFILGGGSNILLPEKFSYQCLKNSIYGIQEIPSRDTKKKYFRVGAGENWDQFVLYACNQNLYGVENLSMIPGSVGASVVQNIGAYGVEIKDVVFSVEGIWLASQKRETFSNKECIFSYRMSLFKSFEFQDHFCITHVTYTVSKESNVFIEYLGLKDELSRLSFLDKDRLLSSHIRQAVINIRTAKLPDVIQIGNAGSFFKNPVISELKAQKLQKKYPNIKLFYLNENNIKVSAAWMIDYLGFKEKNVRTDKQFYGVWHLQPLILVHYQGATGKEILEFSMRIQKEVLDEFSIILTSEVRTFS